VTTTRRLLLMKRRRRHPLTCSHYLPSRTDCHLLASARCLPRPSSIGKKTTRTTLHRRSSLTARVWPSSVVFLGGGGPGSGRRRDDAVSREVGDVSSSWRYAAVACLSPRVIAAGAVGGTPAGATRPRCPGRDGRRRGSTIDQDEGPTT